MRADEKGKEIPDAGGTETKEAIQKNFPRRGAEEVSAVYGV
jgi:hypothetical protein